MSKRSKTSPLFLSSTFPRDLPVSFNRKILDETLETVLSTRPKNHSIPISRPTASTSTPLLRPLDQSKILTYYHFQINNPHKPDPENSRIGSWTQWAQNKAATTWSGFGKAPEGSWKLKVFRAGEHIVDRLDFEELALHGVDPSLGPTVLHPDVSGQKQGKEAEKLGTRPQTMSLLFPPSVNSSEGTLEHLKQLLASRKPRHKKGMWIWIVAMPFTAPFMIVPIIPNLPFFFCVWRAWGHYRAYRASGYLSALIEKQVIVSEPSGVLDTIYRGVTPKLDASNEFLLSRDEIPAVVSTFELTERARTDIYRALEQANTRLSKS